MDVQRLSGKRVVITAGASGIGLTVAKAFLAEDAHIAVCDIDQGSVEAFSQHFGESYAARADVTDETDVEAFFEGALAHLGGLDILINNAGIAGPAASIETMDYAGWQACLDVNLGGLFLASRAGIPALKASGGGAIINMSSTAGLFGFPNRAPYCAAKWGVIGLTKTLAMELGGFGIRANAICPGAVEGERMEKVLAAESKATGVPVENIRRSYVECTSLKSWVTAEDIADTILYLCSDGARRISGQVVAVDGHSESIS